MCSNVFVRVGARISVDANIEDSNKGKKTAPRRRDTSGNSVGTGPADRGAPGPSSSFQDKVYNLKKLS